MPRYPMRQVWPRLERAAMRALWRHLARRAADRTAALSTGSCLILAPHPDDETLGCGGLAMRKRKHGARVHVAVVTDGAATHEGDPTHSLTAETVVALRERETREACDILGVPAEAVTFLRYPDGRLASVGPALEDALADLVARLNPDEVFVCARADGHRDHQALAAAVAAAALAGRMGTAAIWEYPVWFWDFRSWRPEGLSNKAGFVAGLRAAWSHATHLRPVSVSLNGLVPRKRAALGRHRSQLGTYGQEPDWKGLPVPFLRFFFRDRELFFRLEGADDR